jgi:hypothetical protein
MHSSLSVAAVLAAALATAPCTWAAARHKPAHNPAPAANTGGPSELGEFQAWTAATYKQGGDTVCYAFTRAHVVGGSGDSGPLLTITERPGSRDEVAITNPTAYPKDAEVMLQVGQKGVQMYTAGRDAFARDPKAAIAAFQRGSQAVTRVQVPKGAPPPDTYSLDGFTKAHDAIVKACPAR